MVLFALNRTTSIETSKPFVLMLHILLHSIIIISERAHMSDGLYYAKHLICIRSIKYTEEEKKTI